MKRLEGKIAAVTGAGAGIGRAIAVRLASDGAHVWVTDLDGKAAENAAAEITQAGGTATARAVNVALGQDVTGLLRDMDAAHGRADILVNNAGINVRDDFRHLSDEGWERLRDVNLDGVIRIARDGFALLRAGAAANGASTLINLASIMGNRGQRGLAAYGATKGAVSALTRALAVEYAPFGIRVNALAPGFIETALTERVLKVPAINRALLERTPMRRFGTPEDVAAVAAFLASDDATFVSGAEIPVDGGMAAAL